MHLNDNRSLYKWMGFNDLALGSKAGGGIKMNLTDIARRTILSKKPFTLVLINVGGTETSSSRSLSSVG